MNATCQPLPETAHPPQQPQLSKAKIKELHLSSYLKIFPSDQHLIKFASQHILESNKTSNRALALAKWTNFSTLCKTIVHDFSSIKREDFTNIFLDGLCTAAVVHFFSSLQFGSAIESVPFPLGKPIVQQGVTFYPINPHDPQLIENTRKLRFCMEAYRVAVAFKQQASLEYVPATILQKLNLKVTGSYPKQEKDQEGCSAYCIQGLLQVMTELESQNNKCSYLMGVTSNHAVGLGLQKPYHLFDPAYGIAVTESQEAFLLFLANYLTNKYPDTHHFQILEFSSQ